MGEGGPFCHGTWRPTGCLSGASRVRYPAELQGQGLKCEGRWSGSRHEHLLRQEAEACCTVKQLVTLVSILKVVALEHKLWNMGTRTRVLETTLDRASWLVEDLSACVANLAAGSSPGVPTPGVGIAAADFLMFKATQEHAMASIQQELKDHAGGS